jgi:hypothetical protein
MDDEKIYIPPDYDSDDEDDIDDILSEDEGAIETYYDNKLKEEEKQQQPMTAPVFPSQPPQPTTPRWGQPTGTTTFPWQNQQAQGGMWGPGGGTWRPGGTTPAWNQGGNTQKEQINRNKKVVFIDFLDGIVETLNSNESPGFLPRDIYDLKPRFDVWQRLSAFSPERVYIMIPKNLLPSTNGAQGWEATLTYFCCALSSFIRVPFTNCQILVGSVIGQSKESLMLSVINDKNKPIDRNDIVCIGIYSGYNGQPDIDKHAAEVCGVDYIDLYNLLNNMI